ATDPVWAGGADELQLRARRTPRGVRVHFVAVPPARPRSRSFTRVALAAEAGDPKSAGPPPIVTRAEWGAGKVPPRGTPGYGQVQMAFVHHTVSANDYRPEDSAAIVLAITKYHRDTNGWNDIGYNLLVDQYGQVFEGRAGGVGQAVIGAQAQGWNGISTGIATIGTFSDVAFPEAGVAALARVLAWKLSLHQVPTTGTFEATSIGGAANRYRSGTKVTFERISGHRDGCTTSCPGTSLYAQLPDLRGRAQKLAGKIDDNARLTVVPAAVAVTYGQEASFSGVLRGPDGAAIGGVPVALQKQGKSRWVTVGAGRTVSDGTWFSDVVWRRGAAVRAVATVPATGQEVRSAPVSVSVGYVLEVDPTARRVRQGRSTVLTGRMRPGGPVTVRVDRQVGGRWVRVGDVRARVGANGRFRAKALLRRPGVYRLRVLGGEKAKLVRAPPIYVRAVRNQADVARTANGPDPLTEAVSTAREAAGSVTGAGGGASAG
ncbi:MAG: N-acetylmuramoyl-L-alanine amidase, partial [Solirubrobacterales bacterium]|nr:N-acetylmuramoyl-L-alanine amidase [Solirubrobacterales bacterium]